MITIITIIAAMRQIKEAKRDVSRMMMMMMMCFWFGLSHWPIRHTTIQTHWSTGSVKWRQIDDNDDNNNNNNIGPTRRPLRIFSGVWKNETQTHVV